MQNATLGFGVASPQPTRLRSPPPPAKPRESRNR